MLYRWLVERQIERVTAASRAGDMAPSLALWADDGHFVFPGRHSWAADYTNQRDLGAWYDRFAKAGLQIEPAEVLVAGPPWRTTVCVHFTDHADGPDGRPVYENTGVLFFQMRWGKIRFGTVYEDTQKVADFDAYLTAHDSPARAPVATA